MSKEAVVRKGYRAELDAGDVTIEQRDIEMLQAIDRTGSLHSAADALERSYARIQRRIVALEAVVGSLTVRKRGGSGGGGTELTHNARALCRRFDRHVAELKGLADVPESVIPGRITKRSGELATITTPVGVITGLASRDAERVEIVIRADAVVLSDPSTVRGGDDTSLRNQLTGEVAEIIQGDATALVEIYLADEHSLRALVTKESLHELSVHPGGSVGAGFKATAARATPHSADARPSTE